MNIRQLLLSVAAVLIITSAFLIARSAADSPALLSQEAEWVKYQDIATGHDVWQVTSSDFPSQATHFNSQGFTAEERYMVFSSSRTGSWQLFRVDLETGEVAQLTDVPNLDETSFTVHPVRDEVYFSYDSKLGGADIHTGESIAFDFDFPVTFRRMFSRDGRYAVLTTPDGDGVRVMRVSFPEGGITGEFHWGGALGWEGRLSHTLINPGNPDLISFVPGPDTQNDMTQPMERRARTWIGNVVTGETRQFLTMPYGYRATHESWGRSGERFYFFQKSQPGWVPVSIGSMNVDGTDWRTHYTHDSIRLGHGAASDDERWFISDGQDPYQNPLVLINLDTGNAEIMAWSNSSIVGGHAVQAHVHPSLSPSGRYIAYTSNRTGTPQAYVIRVPEEVQQRLSASTASR